ncbi:MAG: PorP/SprF family type IX secretion system membrane protein [Cytophagales bacterium]|nr:PorP/SprF family type IX secretion system membrane protein [Cytophagales bacterium]
MQKLGIVVAAIIVLNTPLSLLAQDPQFTQFYANPLYLNPALTGASELTRVGVGYRNQWPALGYNFRTYYAYVDHFSPWYNSGVGLAVMSDRAGDLSLGFSGVHLSYAYKLWLSPNWAFRPGFSVGYLNYGLDASRIRASSQFGPDGSYDPTAATGLAVNETLHLLDLGVGGVFHGKNLWVGYSVYHLNFPNQSLIGSEDQMALRHSAHGGYKWKFSSQMVEGRFFYGGTRTQPGSSSELQKPRTFAPG